MSECENKCDNCECAEKTITVAGYFGKDKEITRDDFIKTWTNHSNEMKRLCYEMDWMEEVSAMTRKIEKVAGQEFDRLYEQQSKA